MAKGVKGARDAYNECGEIVVYAMAREGEELAKIEKAKGGGDRRSERRKTTGNTKGPVIAEPMTLKELGISHNEASRAQRIASIPKAKLRARLDAAQVGAFDAASATSLVRRVRASS